MLFDILPWWAWVIAGFILGFGLELLICYCRKDGVIHITKENDADRYLFEFNVLPEKIPHMHQVVFKTKVKEPQEIQSP